MLVQAILTLINSLKCREDLSDYDRGFCVKMESYFAQLKPIEVINNDAIQFITRCYEERWNVVIDTDNDYTINPEGANDCLISFANEFAIVSNKQYWSVLMPTIKNTLDFNNGSKLSETKRPGNFYLGSNDEILYRKRGLYDVIIHNQFKLCTAMGTDTFQLRALTIKELTRIQSCTQRDSEFSIDGEEFLNFWDYLNKKSFPFLQAEGKLPLHLFPHCARLIEKYFVLKEKNESFTSFKKIFNDFSALLSKNPLNNINHFYGIKIKHAEGESYLLELLITIQKAKSYHLDEQLRDFAGYLFRMNPAVKCSFKGAELIYERVEKNNLPIMPLKQDVHPCWYLFISLLTTKDSDHWRSVSVSFWDKENTVSQDAGQILTPFLTSVICNRFDETPVIYDKIISEYKTTKDGSGLFAQRSPFSSIVKWFNTVAIQDKFGVHWFNPEFFLSSLIYFESTQGDLNNKITMFLDQLIHTYAQSADEWHKALRVNVQFTKMMNELKLESRNEILLWMSRHEGQGQKEYFINNCVVYMNKRLGELEFSSNQKSTYGFCNAPKYLNEEQKKTDVLLTNVVQLIDNIMAELNSLKEKHDLAIYKKLHDYLSELKRPILSVSERKHPDDNAHSYGYYGAFT